MENEVIIFFLLFLFEYNYFSILCLSNANTFGWYGDNSRVDK